MASIRKRKTSPFYHAYFRNANGEYICRSTKCKERGPAMIFALKMEQCANNPVEEQARKVVSDILESAGGKRLLDKTASEFLMGWIKGKESSASAGTAKRYSVPVENFLKMLAPDKQLASVTVSNLELFRDKMLQAGNTPQTVCFNLATLKRAFEVARKQRVIEFNPVEAVEMPRAKAMVREVFTLDEVKRLITTAEGEWKTLIMLGYFTGARLGDCARMRWENVDLQTGVLTFTQTKTGAKLTTPLHHELVEYLKEIAINDIIK